MRLLAALALGIAAGWGLSAWAARRRLRREGRLLAFAAHELNTPLTSVHMTATNFLNGTFGALAPEHGPWLALIREQALRLEQLVGELRDFVHFQLIGDFRSRPEPVELAPLAREALEAARGSLERAGCRIEAELPEGLPAARADGERLLRVLSSLLAHARKFRSSGPVRVALRLDGGELELSVSYAAPPSAGSPEEELDLHYPASRGASEVLPGVGLGLGLCRVLIEAQGGRMTLEEEPSGLRRAAVRLPAHSGKC